MSRSVRYIVVHHSASDRDATVSDVRRWHLGRGWRDIGYHYCIRQPVGDQYATVHVARPHNLDKDWEPWEYGAHSRGENDRSIGVCLIGDFDRDTIPADMLDRLVDQCAALCATFGLGPDAVLGHQEMPGASTVCPGRYVRMTDIRARLVVQLAA